MLPRALFFLSGAVALAQEVLWMRRFTALLGATAAATAATLAGVFLGFALGSFAAARYAARVQRPLRAYAKLELAAAAAALLLLPLLSGAESIVPPLRGALAGAPTLARVLETLLTAALLLVPAAFLGATLPVLAPALGRDGGRALYAANTFGAVVGSLAVPFVLLPRLGVSHSYLAIVALGAATGAWAWLVDRTQRDRPAPSMSPTPPTPSPRRPQPIAPPSSPSSAPSNPALPLPARSLAFVSGLILLALEAAATRLFAQVHESSLHAFAVVVAAFLLALWIGTVIARLLLRLRIERRVALAATWLAAGLLTAAIPRLFDAATHGLTIVTGTPAESLRALVAIAALVLVPPIALGGAALPLLLGPARATSDAGELGRVLGWNTLGAIAGPLLATFVAFPSLGLFATFASCGGALLLGAAFLLLAPAGSGRGVPSRARAASAIVVLAAVAIGALAAYPPPRVRLDPENDEQLIELREGPLAIVSVIEGRGAACIKLDNHYTLGGTRAIGDQRQLGHLPLLLHAAPRRVAFLGLGTGITAGAALLHPVESIDAVELVPEVAELAARHFDRENLGLLRDPRVHLLCDDARPFLRGREGRFDVIVGDLVVPWRAGESALYTAEHFAQARAALAPGGLFCQWLPAYQLTAGQFDAIAATFLDVFPRATLWRGDLIPPLPTLGLVGHLADVDPAAVAARVRALVPKLDPLSPYLMDPAGPWLFCVGALDPGAARFRAARRHSRDFPWLELAGPTHDESGTGRLFTGAPLDQLLAEVAGTPLAGGPLAALGADELAWRAAGADLWRASSLATFASSREQQSQAQQLGLATLSRLPAGIRDAVLGSARR